METWSVAHRDLQLFCADFWPSAQDCQSILNEIGMSSGRIDLSEPSIMRWLSILLELMRQNNKSMGRLVTVLMKQYPDNQDLRKVCAPWIPAEYIQAGEEVPAVSTGDTRPSRVPPPRLDYNEETSLILARIESIWVTVIDLEKRLAKLERWRKNGDTV